MPIPPDYGARITCADGACGRTPCMPRGAASACRVGIPSLLAIPTSAAVRSRCPPLPSIISPRNRTTNRRTDEYGGSIENRARILFEVVEAVLEEVDPSRVGVKIGPMHDGGPMAANDETLPITEYAVRKLDGYDLSHLLLMGNTTDFTGTPLESLMGDGMFRHFRPIFRGKLIANVGMTAKD